jgi:hypothetical protein
MELQSGVPEGPAEPVEGAAVALVGAVPVPGVGKLEEHAPRASATTETHPTMARRLDRDVEAGGTA